MKKLTTLALLIPYLCSCVFYTPLKEREQEDGWSHFEAVDTNFKISNAVSFHNEVRALWALSIVDNQAVLQRIKKKDADTYKQQGWTIVHHDLYAFKLFRGNLTIRGLKPHWVLLSRHYYGRAEIKVR